MNRRLRDKHEYDKDRPTTDRPADLAAEEETQLLFKRKVVTFDPAAMFRDGGTQTIDKAISALRRRWGLMDAADRVSARRIFGEERDRVGAQIERLIKARALLREGLLVPQPPEATTNDKQAQSEDICRLGHEHEQPCNLEGICLRCSDRRRR